MAVKVTTPKERAVATLPGSPVCAPSVEVLISANTLPHATISGAGWTPLRVGNSTKDCPFNVKRRVQVRGNDNLAFVHVIRKRDDRSRRTAQ